MADLNQAATDLGVEMWQHLSGAFIEVAIANGFDTPAKRARMWAGFIGSVGGAMAADLGVTDSAFVLDMLKNANTQVARSTLHLVPEVDRG